MVVQIKMIALIESLFIYLLIYLLGVTVMTYVDVNIDANFLSWCIIMQQKHSACQLSSLLALSLT